jgi:quercetin dioxygenase-like cupin family protein
MSDLFKHEDFSAPIELSPGVTTRVISRGNIMFSLVQIADGVQTEIHSHPEVQMGLILKGAFERQQGDEVQLLGQGDGFYVPPNVPHGGRAVGGDCEILDVFVPPRAEYARKV